MPRIQEQEQLKALHLVCGFGGKGSLGQWQRSDPLHQREQTHR